MNSNTLDYFPRSKEEIPPQYRLNTPIRQQHYLVGGHLHEWNGPDQEAVSVIGNQMDGGFQPLLIGSYPALTGQQAMEALAAAFEAYNNGRGVWPTMPVEGRIRHVEDFVFRIQDQRDLIIRLLMWEIGKSAADSAKEFDRTVDYIRDTISALKDLDRISSRFSIEQGIVAQIRRAPLGVALCMGPYNYPLNETFTTLIPALIMGNTVVFKPPRIGVLLHYPLLEAFRDSFPAGVVNTVYGSGQEVITPMMESGRIDVLAFIGSSRVADIIKSSHPKPHRLRCVFGLEAKNAGIILPDADMSLTVRECLLGTLSYNGQRCTALKNLFVHSSVADHFIEEFIQAVQALPIGMPWVPNVSITPLPELEKVKYLQDLIDDAVQKGARIMNSGGGESLGTLMRPAVLYPVTRDMRVFHEEQFGPVVPVSKYDSLDIPIDHIVHSNFGQQVSIFGRDPDRIAGLIDPLVNQVCRVNINSQCQRGPDTFPFTGRKDSAEGTLSVTDALRVFSIRTLVATKLNPINKQLIRSIVQNRKSNFLSTDFIL